MTDQPLATDFHICFHAYLGGTLSSLTPLSNATSTTAYLEQGAEACEMLNIELYCASGLSSKTETSR